jgi:WD40 repeat protein
VATGKKVGTPLRSARGIVWTALSPDGRRAAVLDRDNRISVGETATGRWLDRSLRLPFSVAKIIFSPDGEKVLTAGGQALVWRVATGELLASLALGGTDPIYARFSSDGRFLMTGDSFHGTRLWDAETGMVLTPPLRHGGSLIAAAFQTDHRELIAAAKGGAVSAWTLPDTDATDKSAQAIGPPVTDNSSGPGESRVLAAEGKTIRARPWRDGIALASSGAADDGAVEGLLSLDESHVLFCDANGGLRVWDVEKKKSLCRIPSRGSRFHYAALSADGARLITASEGRTARIWDTATGELLAPALHLKEPIRAVCFRADGNQAVAVGVTGTIRTLDLTPESRSVEELKQLAEILACGRIEADQRARTFDTSELRAAWDKLQKKP